jgi:hypothetical protein
MHNHSLHDSDVLAANAAHTDWNTQRKEGSMRQTMLVCAVLGTLTSSVSAQTVTNYRFRADTLVGTVWVSGEDARRELESGEGGIAAGRVEIWKNGGAQVFILNPTDRTYYEENAFLARQELPRVSAAPLTVRAPFEVEGVENVYVDLKVATTLEGGSKDPCRRAVLTFSYTMKLRLAQPGIAMPAIVEGTQDSCITDRPNAPRLPFGHRLELTSGHPEVDAAIAARLAPLQGIPVARMLTVARRLENGETITAKSGLVLSDIQEVPAAAERFEVPKDYRFKEPEIVPPVRKRS